MTGLDYENDVILQICCYITDSKMKFLEEEGIDIVIHYDKPVLDKMGEWCQSTHTAVHAHPNCFYSIYLSIISLLKALTEFLHTPHQTGLITRVLSSTTTVESATTQLLSYIRSHVPTPRYALLAGNSVHADRAFLARQFPSVIEHLNYRILDVSTVKEAVRMWCSDKVLRGVPRKTETHEARMDILESIKEMEYYKRVLFNER